jgi:hypothetical protein
VALKIQRAGRAVPSSLNTVPRSAA